MSVVLCMRSHCLVWLCPPLLVWVRDLNKSRKRSDDLYQAKSMCTLWHALLAEDLELSSLSKNPDIVHQAGLTLLLQEPILRRLFAVVCLNCKPGLYLWVKIWYQSYGLKEKYHYHTTRYVYYVRTLVALARCHSSL